MSASVTPAHKKTWSQERDDRWIFRTWGTGFYFTRDGPNEPYCIYHEDDGRPLYVCEGRTWFEVMTLMLSL